MAETLISPGVLAREQDISFLSPVPLAAGAAIIGPTVKGPVEVPTLVTSYGQYQRIFGVTFNSGSNQFEYLTSLAAKSYFEQGGESILVTRVVSGSFTAGTSTNITPASGSTSPFTLETIGQGAIFNNSTGALDPGSLNTDGSLVSGSADNVRWEIANIDNTAGTFSVYIRRGDDSTKDKIVLEAFNDLSLDPNSSNYIEKVIGNQVTNKSVDVDSTVYVQTVGEFINRSSYVRVSAVNTPTLNYLATDELTVNVDAFGNSYSGSLPVASSGSFYGATGDLFRSTQSGSFFSEISDVDTQGLEKECYDDAISILGNKDEYLFNVLSAPGLIQQYHTTQVDAILSLCQERGDAIAVVDLVPYGTAVSNAAGQAATLNSSYGATYWPWLQMMSATGKNVWVPASVVVPGIYAFTDRAAAPWFAPAGLTRGGIDNVIQAERKLTKAQRDILYAANVNPIATFPGTGISIFGQKTLQKKKSALDRVNVRRLLIELKKTIGDVARTLVFEQNTVATRNSFLARVNPYLDSVVNRQGLYAYKVIMDETNNTPDVVDRNMLIGKIYVQPAKTAEFIYLDFTITATGVSFEG